MSDSLAGKTCPLQNGRKAGVDVGGGVERPFPVQWKLATWKWPDDPLSSHRMHPFIVWRQKRPKLFTFFLLVQCIPPEGPCSYDVCVLWGEELLIYLGEKGVGPKEDENSDRLRGCDSDRGFRNPETFADIT